MDTADKVVIVIDTLAWVGSAWCLFALFRNSKWKRWKKAVVVTTAFFLACLCGSLIWLGLTLLALVAFGLRRRARAFLNRKSVTFRQNRRAKGTLYALGALAAVALTPKLGIAVIKWSVRRAVTHGFALHYSWPLYCLAAAIAVFCGFAAWAGYKHLKRFPSLEGKSNPLGLHDAASPTQESAAIGNRIEIGLPKAGDITEHPETPLVSQA